MLHCHGTMKGIALTQGMQVVGTLRHKVLHYGGGGIPLHIYARPCICRWWGHSGARSCTMGLGVLSSAI